MAKAKKELSELENRLRHATENYTYHTLIGHAMAYGIFEDYVQVVSKIEGVEPRTVIERITTRVHEALERDGWALYEQQDDDGNVFHALGMLWHGMLIKTAPVPVLKMPMEVDGEEPPKKKKRKRYI